MNRKKAEKKEKMEYERKLVSNLEREIEKEKQDKVEKKQKLIQTMDLIKQENEKQEELIRQQKQQMRDLDNKLAEDYIKNEEMKEKKKKAELQKRADQISGFMKKMEQGALRDQYEKEEKLLGDI